MPPAQATSTYARATHTVRPEDVVEVLCHRQVEGSEQYLVRWRTNPVLPAPPRAICSWHPVSELWHSLHLVQAYIDTLPKATRALGNLNGALTSGINRKRKSPDSDPIGTRDLAGNGSGLLTPQDSIVRSRSSSVIDLGTPEPPEIPGPNIYNGVLQKKEGRIVAKRAEGPEVTTINSRNLPTEEMRRIASRTPVVQAEKAIRAAFEDKLAMHDPRGLVRLENDIDTSTPSLDFTFIREYVLGDGVSGISEEEYRGCTKCKADMGGNVGCEYSTKCDCLQFAAVDEKALERTKPETYGIYMIAKADGDDFDTAGLPKRFPYRKPGQSGPQTLLPFYRESRHPIYECNRNCKCGPKCKTRLVQKGRKAPLVVFKTQNRGWGVYCDEDLIQGEFIDTYLGEVITEDECKRRENQVGLKSKASYLYSLDKFVGDLTTEGEPLLEEDTYVVDGQYMGNVTRFINHSCQPNCRQYTVSYNKHDLRLFNLAFFAYEDIAAGTELTFDYADKDEVELEEAIKRRDAALANPENHDSIPCNCGAPKCRGYLWD
ncbi:Histone-lysine N-methyltransferase, H3 lysine-9 specific dim-5 [Pseudocercospora fuligena]|uniref:Histone-lysine N-methyltransferase, H3 lysine-9 specific dim-5 n=1 Tax=Pseudocercospora fuligena TaxID=685502 RepID=A0A8H6RRJ2_9PEZI|nr:Histone-lysine N-methyltransferase, H3 lysine-9 specific dim-5 [Pseudocercospora fuligena]